MHTAPANPPNTNPFIYNALRLYQGQSYGSSIVYGGVALPPGRATHCHLSFVGGWSQSRWALNAPLVHIGHHAHDGGSARAGQTLQHVSIKVVNSAWAGHVRWVCSRGG
jgi:hypothetical protein